ELRAQPGEIRPAGDALLVCLRAQRAGLVLPGDPHLLAAPGARVGGAGAYQNSGRSYSAISGSRHYDDRGNRDLGLGVDTGLHYLPSIGIAFAPPVPARLSDGARILRSSAVAAVSVLPAEDERRPADAAPQQYGDPRNSHGPNLIPGLGRQPRGGLSG